MRLIRADSDPREADPELSNRAAEAERVSDELSQLPARLRPAEGGGRAHGAPQTSLIFFMANQSMRNSSRPWYQRLMLVAP